MLIKYYLGIKIFFYPSEIKQHQEFNLIDYKNKTIYGYDSKKFVYTLFKKVNFLNTVMLNGTKGKVTKWNENPFNQSKFMYLQKSGVEMKVKGKAVFTLSCSCNSY